MTQRAGSFLIPLLGFLHAAIAVAQESKAIGPAFAPSVVPAEAGSWPWIAVAGLVVTLGAISLISRRMMPFGDRD